MVRFILRLTFFCSLIIAGSGLADSLSKMELAKRGKAATAYLDVPGVGSGTAFCIHSAGLFITNEHVVHGAQGAEILLVLNPSLPTEKVLKAKVVRSDKDVDLALLRVEGVTDIPALELGITDGIAELTDVVACGFPLGKALASSKKEFPAISVNAGSVTALRQTKGELQLIQIDVALTFGSSGGPVLDANGKVIGVVVSGLAAGKVGINQAIPVNIITRFLNMPDISFAPPDISMANVDKIMEFKAKVLSALPRRIAEDGLRDKRNHGRPDQATYAKDDLRL